MIPFVKMHGLGNDYVFVDALAPDGRRLARRDDFSALAVALSDRRRGVGSDGLILLCEPTDAGRAAGAAFRMRIWNADGSEAEMCGNGLRCAVRLAVERGRVAQDNGGAVRVEAGGRTLEATPTRAPGGEWTVTVDMGEPAFGPDAVHADRSRLEAADGADVRLDGVTLTLISVGNPHAVAFVQAREGVDRIESLGPLFERHRAFPVRINVHFALVVERGGDGAPGVVLMRSWERGAGLTSACGTGACAVLAAGVATERVAPDATLRLPGGELRVRWDARSGRLWKAGPATMVFEGVWPG